ncbi:unnamed protein product [Orchesella dallaii]|uniref:Uncharacterized protein n=1 Tax=Orchesella dallaii TaxID=48710 RepID=A0ABP1RUI3_9HEXA
MDPLDMVLEDALPDAKYWSSNTILLAFSIRFICCQITMSQGTQAIITFALMAGAVTVNILHCMQILLNDIESEDEFLDFYIRFWLAFKLTKDVIDDLLMIFLTGGFYGLAFAFWGCISGYGKLSLIMYISLVIGTWLSFAALLFLFKNLKMGIEMADEILETKRHESRMKLVENKTRLMKRIAKRLKALTAVHIGFGNFYQLTTEYFMEYVNGLLS